MPPKEGKFGWYIESSHLHNSPTSHVTFALKITFKLGFIGRWARFYPFWPPFLPPYAPKVPLFSPFLVTNTIYLCMDDDKGNQLLVWSNPYMVYITFLAFLMCFIAVITFLGTFGPKNPLFGPKTYVSGLQLSYWLYYLNIDEYTCYRLIYCLLCMVICVLSFLPILTPNWGLPFFSH